VWFALVQLVVVEPARAILVVPDLHLRASSQVDAAVATGQNPPIEQKFKITVVGDRAQAVPLAIVNEQTIDDAPVFTHLLIGFFLGGGKLLLGHLRARRGISHETLESTQVTTIKEGREAGGRGAHATRRESRAELVLPGFHGENGKTFLHLCRKDARHALRP
jgi:hypothetical protein